MIALNLWLCFVGEGSAVWVMLRGCVGAGKYGGGGGGVEFRRWKLVLGGRSGRVGVLVGKKKWDALEGARI